MYEVLINIIFIYWPIKQSITTLNPIFKNHSLNVVLINYRVLNYESIIYFNLEVNKQKYLFSCWYNLCKYFIETTLFGGKLNDFVVWEEKYNSLFSWSENVQDNSFLHYITITLYQNEKSAFVPKLSFLECQILHLKLIQLSLSNFKQIFVFSKDYFLAFYVILSFFTGNLIAFIIFLRKPLVHI